MRPDLRLVTSALVGGLLCARTASAQDVQYRVQVAANLQATDNVLFTPMNGRASGVCYDGNPNNDLQNCPTAGFVGEVAPGLLLTYETPRWLHSLAYNFNFAAVLGAGNQINYENRLELRSRYDVSELTQTTFVLRAAQGQQTIFPQALPGQPVAALLPGEFMYTNVEAQETLTRLLSEEAALAQQLGIQVFRPIQELGVAREGRQDPPRAGLFTANFQLAWQYNDAPKAFALTYGAQLTAFDTYCNLPAECGNAEEFACVDNRCVVREGELAAPRREELVAIATSPQLLNRLAGTFRYDWRNGFNTDFDLGVQQIMRVLDGGGQNWQPVGRIAVGYEREEGQFQLIFNHGSQINTAVGGVVFADNIDLTGNLPLDRQTRTLMLQLQLGYQRGSVIDVAGELLPGFDLFAADVGLEYRPPRYLRGANFNVRYQLRYQITEPPLRSGELESLQAMRNTVLFGLGFQFPDRGPGP